MKTLVHLFLLLATYCLYGQSLQRQTLAQSGGVNSLVQNDATLLVSQSIGQASPNGTFKQTQLTVLQGYQQPSLQARFIDNQPSEERLDAKLYPNPVDNVLNIAFANLPDRQTGVQPSSISAILYDTSGKLVWTRNAEGDRLVQLDFSGLSSGVYVLQLKSGGKQRTAQILKR